MKNYKMILTVKLFISNQAPLKFLRPGQVPPTLYSPTTN